MASRRSKNQRQKKSLVHENRMESKTSFDDLPEVLVMDILSRLPVKTLIRSTAVRKVWYSIIKSVSFISLHLSRSVSDSDPSRYYIFLTNRSSCFDPPNDDDGTYSFALISDNPLRTSPFLEKNVFPFETECLPSPQTLIGTCNGLVCLTDNSRCGQHGIYLINPFIHKYRKLDIESSCYADLISDQVKDKNIWDSNIRIGFGYSASEDDYKVLRIMKLIKNQKRKRSTSSGYSKTKPLIEIYSLKTAQWKTLGVSINFELPSTFDSATCVLGCLYWCMRNWGTEKKKEYLLCFDLKDEVFSKIELPTTYHKLRASFYHCDTFNKNDSLVVVLYDYPSTGSASRKTKMCVLVLEKNLHWKEFSYKCSHSRFDPKFDHHKYDDDDDDFDSEDHPSLNALGFSAGGKLIFGVGYKGKSYVVAVELDKKCKIQEFDFSFKGDYDDFDDFEEEPDRDNDDIYGTTNVLESLVLFSD